VAAAIEAAMISLRIVVSLIAYVLFGAEAVRMAFATECG